MPSEVKEGAPATLDKFTKFTENAVEVRKLLEKLTPILKKVTMCAVACLPRMTETMRRLKEET